MDYDVVKNSVESAYKYFGNNDDKFYTAMENFYKEGKNNPTVAKIIMQDNIRKKQLAAGELLSGAANLNFTDNFYMAPDAIRYQQVIYNFSTNSALKSIEAEDIYNNTKYLNDADSLQDASVFKENWNKLYPKTAKIRERIIDANRISMDKVNKKAGWLDKINFAKTLAEYKKDYPKSFYARYALIMNGQINEDEITPRIKNWFKRFSYKRLIKKGFSFKK